MHTIDSVLSLKNNFFYNYKIKKTTKPNILPQKKKPQTF